MSPEKEVLKKVTWKIPNITKELLSSRDAKKAIFSKSFLVYFGVNFTEWKLWLLPAHRKTKDVGLYLRLVQQSTLNFKSDIKFAIYNTKKNKDKMKRLEKSGKDFSEGTFSSWGYDPFKDQGLLRKFDEFVIDGTLTVVCELTITPYPEIVNLQPSDFSKLYQNNFLADFELVAMKDGVQTESFKCHKLVLAQKSKFFERMFNEEFKEAQGGKCEIPDLSPTVIQEMLRFMYCGKVEELDKIAAELIFAAEKYGINELKSFCITNYLKKLNETNVIDVLIISNRMPNMNLLFQKCVEIIIDNYQSVSKKSNWKKLPRDLVFRVVELIVEKTGGSSAVFL